MYLGHPLLHFKGDIKQKLESEAELGLEPRHCDTDFRYPKWCLTSCDKSRPQENDFDHTDQ